jgi:hypothetical protein
VFWQAAAEAAVEHMIAAVDGLPDSFTDDNRTRTKIRTENANASDLCVRRDPPNNPGYGGTMTIDIGAIARFDFNLDASIDHVQVVQEGEAGQGRMIDFHPGIDYGDADAFPRALFQSAARFVQAKRTWLRG